MPYLKEDNAHWLMAFAFGELINAVENKVKNFIGKLKPENDN